MENSKLKDLTNISINEGSFPVALTAKQAGTDVQLNLSYTGEAFTDQFGKNRVPIQFILFLSAIFNPTLTGA